MSKYGSYAWWCGVGLLTEAAAVCYASSTLQSHTLQKAEILNSCYLLKQPRWARCDDGESPVSSDCD
jgi:hypothetical protein